MAPPERTAGPAASRPARIPVSDPGGWRDALAHVPHAFGHTWEHCEAMARASGRPTFLLRLETSLGPCLCPLQERAWRGRRDLVTPYGSAGFVGAVDGPDLPRLWRRFAEREGYVCAYVALHPAFGAATPFLDGTAVHHRTLYLLDLRPPEDGLLRAMSTSRRRELRRPIPPEERAWSPSELTAFFVQEYPAFMAARGAAPVYDVPAEVLTAWVRSPGARLVGAGREAVEAVALFGATRWLGTYLFGVWTGEGVRYGARLIWQMARELAQEGVPRLDLGGGVRPGDGVAEFKRRFGAAEAPLHALEQVFDEEAYRRLCTAAGQDPERSGYFPAYRRSA